MRSYIYELAPWEMKGDYYNDIRLGKEVRAQVESLNKQTEALVALQLASSDAIIASKERIAEGVDSTAYGIEHVQQGLFELKAAFKWSIADVVWQIEQSREILESVFQVVDATLDAQARKLKMHAEEAYAHGCIEEALKQFLALEKVAPDDFTAYLSIGIIYLFYEKERKKALAYFDKAITYARPISDYYTSYALLHKALIKRDLGAIEEAEEHTAEAARLCPNFAEACYQNALYNALLNKPDKALPMLKRAIELDVNYCEKSSNEKDFHNIRDHLGELFKELREKEATKAHSHYASICEKHNQINQGLAALTHRYHIKIRDNGFHHSLERVEQLLKRRSYRDYLEANALLQSIPKKQKEMVENIEEQIMKRIRSLKDTIKQIKTSHPTDIKKYTHWLTMIWLGVPISIMFGIRQWWIVGPVNMGSALQSLFALIKVAAYGSIITGALYFIWLLIVIILSRLIVLKKTRNNESAIQWLQNEAQDLNRI